MKTKKITLPLPCKLEIPDLIVLGEELVGAMREESVLDTEFSEIKAQYKAKIEAVEVRIGKASDAIRSKEQERDVACLQQFDVGRGKVKTVRLDTSEIVHSRDMTQEERSAGNDFFEPEEEA